MFQNGLRAGLRRAWQQKRRALVGPGSREAAGIFRSTADQFPATTNVWPARETAWDNAEVLRPGPAAFNAADLKARTEIFHPGVSWHKPGRSRGGQ